MSEEYIPVVSVWWRPSGPRLDIYRGCRRLSVLIDGPYCFLSLTGSPDCDGLSYTDMLENVEAFIAGEI